MRQFCFPFYCASKSSDLVFISLLAFGLTRSFLLLMHWLTDKLNNWLTVWLTEWLILQLINVLLFQGKFITHCCIWFQQSSCANMVVIRQKCMIMICTLFCNADTTYDVPPSRKGRPPVVAGYEDVESSSVSHFIFPQIDLLIGWLSWSNHSQWADLERLKFRHNKGSKSRF